MKKRCPLLLTISLMIFLIAPIVFSDIAITTEQNFYNLGSRIKVSASVLQGNNFEGLFKLTLSCVSYKLQFFYSTPISLEANFRTAIQVQELPVKSSMLGNCTIIGNLVTDENLIVEEKESKSFSVTNQLTVLPVKNRITSSPGEDIQLVGVANEAFGNNVLKAAVKISLDNDSYNIDAVDGKFNITLKIPKGIKSGQHTIEIGVSDSKGNSGDASTELDITAVPTYIKLNLNDNHFLPGSKIEIIADLYDQASDLINASLELELTSTNGNKVFRKIVQSNEKLYYEFSQYAEPGSYTLASTYENLLTQAAINITAIREVKIRYENETVFVENIGNVPFEDELTFILESELKKYPLIKKVNIEPGKILSVDLSKEVPLGVYNVVLPIKEGVEPLKEKVNETIQSIVKSVTIHDNRPAYKKIASGLGSISGALIGADGVLAKNPLIAPLILIVILLMIIFRYGRKPIIRLIKGKKDDNN